MDGMKDIERRLAGSLPPSSAPATEAARRFVARAAELDLVDVAYATSASPLGELVLAATARGLVRLSYDTQPLEEVLVELARQLSPRVLEAPSRLDDVRRQLDEYFVGRRHHFDLPVDLALARGFSRRVLETARRIPYGSVVTYREMAMETGSPKAVRAAGNALAGNPIPIVIPCHRVIRSDGSLSGYVGGVDRKQLLLRLERVELSGGGRRPRSDPKETDGTLR